LGYDDNLVPPLLVSTPEGLFASDNRFGDVKGKDGVPEIAVGRLPVVTAQELRAYIDKISAYEAAGGEWTGRVIMLADNPDNGGNFPGDSSYLATLAQGYSVGEIYLADFPTADDARQRVLEEFNRGAALVNYTGHAGLDRLAAEGMLMTGDVSSLQNGDRLPVITALTCVVGRFAIPGFQTLSESLVLKGNGGAAAVWAPTGASYNNMSTLLAEKFFKAVFKTRAKNLGDALLNAMKDFATVGGDTVTLNMYNLLGDPALEIK